MTARNFFVAAIVAIVIAALGARESWAFLAFLIGAVLLVVAILKRPRERRARLVASLHDHGSLWGDGVGPAPEETGAIIPLDQVPPTLVRSYSGRSDFDVRARRSADASALAKRGYLPTSESFIPGRWRGVDWLGALVFLLFFLIIGIVLLLHMATNKPGGTAVVHYSKATIGAPPLSTPTQSDVAERLRILDGLRTDGLIDEVEWASRRGGILGEI